MKDVLQLIRSPKKGFILIYALLISSICILIALYFFSMEFKKTRHIKSYKNYILKAKKIDEYKEYLFTIMYQNIPVNIRNSNTANVKNFLQQSNAAYIYDNGHSIIKYDAVRNKIILLSYYDEYYHREDLFDYRVVGGKLKFFYALTLYVEGRLA